MQHAKQPCDWEGEKRECPYILDDYKYSFWGWTLLSIGISAKPVRLIRTCSKCHEEIEDITDHKQLMEHIGR
ncbi:hypothetical protein [Candidatus Uabimicrobium amorphum]|uniref:Uncharacterized protein n=1 Tax=Uabimicrobium amorphum TaxID=2596890 RepID=A0A5S9IJ58_UABAM|nr:hypothetical protein [Candidatus Uabimicrobium amorphum]BBM82674.1 hypothetical protein UABAM_01017 [Candidatus Uabimicrobium amorphum]